MPFTTPLHARDVDLKVIQAILGHASYKMTSELYAEVYVEEPRGAADLLDDISAVKPGKPGAVTHIAVKQRPSTEPDADL